ncbi:MAG: ferrous iron transporter B [Synergistaceae bacterium]|nr:ferrous iron transporter B [Synergistaceae bacterium]
MSCRDCRLCFEGGKSCPGRDTKSQRILLMGNPNVGKSVFFSHLTGVHALSSNYPGTTVGFTEGKMKYGGTCASLIDVPGAYTLDPTNEAEEIARRILEEGADRVIMVIDATALERNLVLALQVLEHGLPVIVALNMADEARHRGILINIPQLELELGVPIVPTVAVTGQGLGNLVAKLDEARPSHFKPMSKEKRWQVIGEIIDRVQTVTHRHHTMMDKAEDMSARPVIGGLLGLLVLAVGFTAIRFVGEGMISYVTDPIFEKLWLPLLEKLSALLGDGYMRDILIGKLINGSIDFEQSLGVLSTGIYVEFGMVLPYIIAFYAGLSFLEDVGYLPRLAVVFDALLHKFGIHGYAIIPTLLGFGCNVPGILGTRILESERERFIAATLISVGVPCVSIQAMLSATLGKFGLIYIAAVYGVLFCVWLILGRIMHLTLKGYSPELIIEIPPYRLPSMKAWRSKLWFRIKDFFFEATPLVLGGILLVNLLERIGIMDKAARLFSPVFEGFLGLPAAAAVPIVMGLFRKDIAMGLLIPLDLTSTQTLVAVVVLAMTFPCIATFVVLWRELGVRRTLMSTAIMLSAAMATGGMLNFMFFFASKI